MPEEKCGQEYGQQAVCPAVGNFRSKNAARHAASRPYTQPWEFSEENMRLGMRPAGRIPSRIKYSRAQKPMNAHIPE